MWCGAYDTFHRSRFSTVVGGLALLADLVECLPLEKQTSFSILTCEILDLVQIALFYGIRATQEEKKNKLSK